MAQQFQAHGLIAMVVISDEWPVPEGDTVVLNFQNRSYYQMKRELGDKIKAYLKKTAARTREDLHDAIAAAIDLVTPQNAKNYFATCGYQTDTA